MQKRRIGKGGPEVSALGIGAMSFSDFYGACAPEQAFEVLEKAVELGIDHIDTADIYGNGISETLIGAFLAKQGKQADGLFHIATKAGIARDPDTNARYYNNSLAYLEERLDQSLKRLGVEQVDLFYIHRRDGDMPIEEAAGALARLVEKGKTRAIGFSEIAPSALERALKITPVAAVQSEYSLSTRSPELGLVQRCAEHDVTLVAFSPVGRSLLTDKPHTLSRVQTMPFMVNNPRFMSPNLEANIDRTAPFRALAAELGVPAASLAIGWVLARGDHILPIPGTRSADRLEELAKGALTPLSAAVLDDIDRCLPVGWAHGDRYNPDQWNGPERYC